MDRRVFLQASLAAALMSRWAHGRAADDLAAYKPAVPGRPAPKPSRFGKTSTAEEVTAGMDLSGKTALVTGCNSGLGLETMRVLALRGAHVIGTARSREKAEEACASVEGKTTPVVLELTEFDTVVAAAESVRALATPIDMLICNAGIMQLPELELANGLEKQFVVNHLGHFVLVNRLQDLVVAAPVGRVVVVSSGAHAWAPEVGIQFDNLSGEAGYDPRQAYGQSKLANGLFSRELARRLADTRATSNSLHPGVIDTNLDRYMPPRTPEQMERLAPIMKTIPQGAATSCYVATRPELARVTGWYFSDCNPALPNAQMQDDAMAARLWTVSEELTRDYLVRA